MLEKLRSTYFSYMYKGVFYEQREGAAMGSPVSAIVANLYMKFFEQLAMVVKCLFNRAEKVTTEVEASQTGIRLEWVPKIFYLQLHQPR